MGINKAELQPRNFVDLFMAREDRVMLNARGKIVSQQVKRKKQEFIMRAEAHLNGETRMGFFNMLDDYTVPWAVVVFEEGGPVKDTRKDSALLIKELSRLGFRSARRQKGMFKGENYNVWLFFEQPIASKKVRHLLFTLFNKLGFPRELPVIPTTDILSPGEFGQYIWLPYFNGVDKWRMPDGSIKDGMGIKQDFDFFVDEENNPLKTNLFKIAKNTERDLDQAIIALSTDLANCYDPGFGSKMDRQVVQSFLFSCEGFRNIVNEIESKGTTNEDGLVRLTVLLNTLGQEALLKYYMDKVTDLVPVRFKTKYDTYTGPIFPECIDLKRIGCCSETKVCFPKTAPLKEHLGFWKEDESLEKTQEPTSAGWFFKAIAAKTGGGSEEAGEGQAGTVSAAPDSGAAPGKGVPAPVEIIRPLPDVEVKPLAEFIDEFFHKLEDNRKNYISAPRTFTGLNCGFDALNEILDGLNPGSLILLGGNPGAGKSTFARQMFDLVIEKEKVPVLYISFSLSSGELQLKTMARLSGIPYKNLKRGDLSDADWAKIARINGIIKNTMGEMGFVLEGDETLTPDRITQAVEKSAARFVIVDSLQGMPAPQKNSADRDTLNTVGLISLKRICRSTGIPILTISNGNITDDMEYHADVILHLNPLTNPTSASSDKKPYINLLNVEKNREGVSKVTIQYTFFPPRMTYYGEKVIEYRPAGER